MKSALLLALLLLLGGCIPTDSAKQANSDRPNPLGGEWQRGAMASAANPHAVQAAAEMLQAGGHAVDAAIAAHTVLGLVEPQSSGIGGGGFMLVYQRSSGKLSFHDGRETAPAGATVDMFMRDGEVLDFFESWQSGIAIGVPGAVALYKLAHEQHGKLAWEELFQPAIRLAREGFAVSPRLAGYLPRMAERTQLDENPDRQPTFTPMAKRSPRGSYCATRPMLGRWSGSPERGQGLSTVVT